MDTGELLLTVAFVAAVMVVIIIWTKRKTASSWSGRVEKVREIHRTHQQDENDPGTTEHFVEIRSRTDAGKRVKIELELRVFQQLYPTGLEPGDRITKKAGEWYPTLESAGS